MNFLQATRLMRGISAVAASYAGRFGTQAFEAIPPRAGICEFNERGFRFFASKSKSVSGRRGSTATVETKKAHTAPRRLTFNVGKSAGRNSQGRITAFHRGGGSKRLYRVIDVKRNTPAMGIVERIEYDPNRSSRIALVRWTEGMQPCIQKKSRTAQVFAPPSEILEPKEATIRGVFSFSSISREMDQKNAACLTPAPNPGTVVVGLPTATNTSSKGNFAGNGSEQRRTSVKDVFLSAFSSPKAMDKTAGCAFNSSFNLPRVAVAGAKPSFAAPLLREKDGEKKTFSLSEIQKFKPNSIYWTHRMKRKAAVSWQSL